MKRVLLLPLLLLAAACDRDATAPGDDPGEGLIAYVVPGAEPALFIENRDGTGRFRVHFAGATDRIAGNMPPDLLPVVDAQIKAIGPIEWSPDGRSLAVVLTLAYDQSQVVIIDAQGGSARTASPNMQIILSDVAWSVDGKRIAYTMSTLPHARGIDVFVTELETDAVRRITHDENLGIAGVELAWSADGASLYWTRFSGSQQEGAVENPLTVLHEYELASGRRSIAASGLVGRATGLAHDGAWVLLVRHTAFDGSDYERVLVRRDLGSGGESTVLPASERVLFAELTPGQCRALVAVDLGHSGFGYRLLPLRGGAPQPVLEGAGEPGAADAWISREAC